MIDFPCLTGRIAGEGMRTDEDQVFTLAARPHIYDIGYIAEVKAGLGLSVTFGFFY